LRKRAPKVIQLVEQYGGHPLQAGEWFAPLGDDIAATVVLVHGGFWGKDYERHLEHSVATDLARRGYLCWNIDYRSAAEPWPATLTDVAAAYDHLLLGEFASRVDTRRVAIVGHSAGGHLAAWLASRHRLPAGAPGYNPSMLRPALAVPQAGVLALALAAERRVGRGAVQAFVGGSATDYPERYQVADPIKLLPTGIRSVLIHPIRDKSVPIQQSRLYLEAANDAGDDCSLEVARGDHFTPLDPKSRAHQQLLDALATMNDAE
jgi:acetyl esterase/lipase